MFANVWLLIKLKQRRQYVRIRASCCCTTEESTCNMSIRFAVTSTMRPPFAKSPQDLAVRTQLFNVSSQDHLAHWAYCVAFCSADRISLAMSPCARVNGSVAAVTKCRS